MLHLHHSNKLENLTSSLIELMNVEQGNVLQPVDIMVQNPGMKRWLQQQISQQQGIAANLEFPLPSRFIWLSIRLILRNGSFVCSDILSILIPSL